MALKPRAPVFIGSTKEDLEEHRNAVRDMVLSFELYPRMMEYFAATDATAVQLCMDKVAQSEVYIGIFAHRYGYCPPGSSISITEMEFNKATEKRLERLCFIVDDRYSWPKKFKEGEPGKSKLRTFKTRIGSDLIRSTFTSPDNLASQVGKALHYLLDRPEMNGTLGLYNIVDMTHMIGTYSDAEDISKVRAQLVIEGGAVFDKATLIRLLSEHLGTNQTNIKILQIIAGSVIVQLELPTELVDTLYKVFSVDDKSLPQITSPTFPVRTRVRQHTLTPFHNLIKLYISHAQFESAFYNVEQLKSQVFTDYLVKREVKYLYSGSPPTQRHLLAGGNASSINLNSPNQTDQNTQLSPSARLNLLVKEYEEPTSSPESHDILFSSLENPSGMLPPKLSEMQRRLGENTVLIQFYLHEDNLFLFLVDNRQLSFHSSSLSFSEIDRLISKFRLNILQSLNVGNEVAHPLINSLQNIAERLYGALIQPVARSLRDKTRLIIVPYGILHSLPFHLLYTAGRYLIEKIEVVTLPTSALLVKANVMRRPSTLLHLNSLSETGLPLEAQVVSRNASLIYSGDEATQFVLHQTSSPMQMMHVTAYGQFNLNEPFFDRIELQNQQLELDEFLRRDLSYELVTLSGVEIGMSHMNSDEVIGIGHALMYAGVRALVTSLWRTPDQFAAELMAIFYEGLFQGYSKAAALRNAQLQVQHQHGQLHPAFWGGYELIGNPEPLNRSL